MRGLKYVAVLLTIAAAFGFIITRCVHVPAVTPEETPAQHELSALTSHTVTTGGPFAVPPSVSHIEFIKPPEYENFLTISDGAGRELVRIGSSGRIYLRGKEVRTDAQYRASIRAIMLGAMGCTNEKTLEEAAHE